VPMVAMYGCCHHPPSLWSCSGTDDYLNLPYAPWRAKMSRDYTDVMTMILPRTSTRCQETSTRDTANKRSLELCASIVLLFLGGCSE
jgi:hypothetical protein